MQQTIKKKTNNNKVLLVDEFEINTLRNVDYTCHLTSLLVTEGLVYIDCPLSSTIDS